MNIVYLIVHIPRFVERNTPYFYIGSKYKWKGEGTYYGSSRDPRLNQELKENLLLLVLWSEAHCSKEELLDKEKEFQLTHNSLYSEEFFNRNIANTKLYLPISIEKRVEKFKIRANTVSDSGLEYKYLWAEIARKARNVPDTNGLTANQKTSIYGTFRMNEVMSDGRSYAQHIGDKTRNTLNTPDENGITRAQHIGLKTSVSLRKILPSGITVAQLRALNSKKVLRVEILDICFLSKTYAMDYLGIDKKALNSIIKGKFHDTTYRRLCEILGEDYISERISPHNNHNISVCICGEIFKSYKEAKNKIKITSWSFDRYIKENFISSSMRKSLISYFGEDIYYKYYPQT